jgi:serine/threonine protein kinase
MTRDEYVNDLRKTYSIVSKLAEKNGCMVLRMRHKTLQKDIVLHSLPQAMPIYRELMGIRHENLPLIYDCVDLDDGQIILEEFIDGQTVAQVLETGNYKKTGARTVMLSLCSALGILHGKGFVHRDIKPENIMIRDNGTVVLLDFNASRKITVDTSSDDNCTKKDTVIMGTVGYASPEQLGITQTDARADIYAAGILLNVMLTGAHPSTQLAKGRYGKIVSKCAAISPDDRYQTAEELARAF